MKLSPFCSQILLCKYLRESSYSFFCPRLFDALVVINYLNSQQGNAVTGLYDGTYFPDLNDNLRVTPANALMVIYYLNQLDPGEGELDEDLVFANWSTIEDEFISARKRSETVRS